ncbi:enoyl-CoA hydratase/isomerase family protein [Agromyces sp. ISL-38]|uniref:enoyl-CoA hydratase/isomerase family protein n=1 Tax=Agromyces sp. ISL-38 TaxID=2819107 RepID=UPI001BE9212C|nr:enoyl-CoA hydratase/isomerase family protein [Agromyces sp. ISL-38]MBT2497477.1 enoyl-CoA hydratase/isomerase family protein [Agromyces sp. ISL-38]MBT2517971.1 enoyl-CoA hydratase/isomerase family protein [Streptomyces sp. ISL-90]
MSDDAILFEVSDGLAHITLNRPSRLNAVDPVAIHLWRSIAHEIAERDDIGAVLFDANGRAFCAGGDVLAMSQLAAGQPDAGVVITDLADVIHEGHRVLRGSTKPIVAAVQGPVAGGGLGFMLVADLVIASERATFASRYADVGLTPDCGVSTLLPEAVGTRRALELTLTSRTLSAAEAFDWGLVTEVVAPEALDARAREIATSWLDGATDAFGQTKRLMRAGLARSFREALDDEARTIGAAFETPYARDAVAAFARGASARAPAPTEASSERE